MTVQLIRRTAKDMAGAYYEMQRTDRFRKYWADQKVYIRECWPHFVVSARDTLTHMLTLSTTPAHVKQEIYEALVEEHNRGQSAPPPMKLNIAQTSLDEQPT